MKIVLTKIERGGILDCVLSLEGINRGDALLLRSIENKLKLRDVGILKEGEFNENSEFDLDTVEVEWLLGIIDRQFGASVVNPRLSTSILNVESKLKDINNADD